MGISNDTSVCTMDTDSGETVASYRGETETRIRYLERTYRQYTQGNRKFYLIIMSTNR